MADSKITALTALTAADPANDMIPIVDVSDTPPASGNTKRISINNLLACSPSATLASATITGALGAAGLNVTGATIPANGVYLGSSNNLTFSFNSTIGMSLNAGGLLVNNTSGFNTVANIKLKVGGRFLSGISGVGAYSFGTADAGGFVINDAGDGSTESRLLTLNSTGLGVGESPVSGQKLTVNGSGSVRNGNRLYLWDTGNSTAHGIYNSGDNLTFFKNNGTASMTLDASGNLILQSSATPATLTTNGQLTVNATSDTNLRFSYRGSDGTTRVANITLA